MHLLYPTHLSLYPFQIATVTRTLDFLSTTATHGAYVANEQGLGKTITALVTANSLPSTHTLIICPAIMRLVWEEEIYKWCRFSATSVPKVLVIEHTEDVFGVSLSAFQFVICSYALTNDSHVLSALTKCTWDLLISDENHNCKNIKAKRTKALFSLATHAKYKLLMSGTPMSANVVDLFCPCFLLSPHTPHFGTFNAFAERYSNSTELSVPVFRNGHTQSILVKKYYGLKNAKELSDIIRSTFFIRYKKEDVLTELPPKIFQKIILPEKYSVKVQEKNREKLLREGQLYFEYLKKGLMPPPPTETFAEHRRVQGEAKVKAVVEFVKEKLEAEIPVVLFAYHHSVINALSTQLFEYDPVVITGDTPAPERQTLIASFQQNKTNLFIGNFVAAGVGITLTRASTVVLAELDWIPNNISQSIDRVHRITQKNQVLVYWFLVRNSLDEAMNTLIMTRAKEASSVLD